MTVHVPSGRLYSSEVAPRRGLPQRMRPPIATKGPEMLNGGPVEAEQAPRLEQCQLLSQGIGGFSNGNLLYYTLLVVSFLFPGGCPTLASIESTFRAITKQKGIMKISALHVRAATKSRAKQCSADRLEQGRHGYLGYLVL